MARLALMALFAALLAATPARGEEALVGIALRAKDVLFLSLDADRDGAISRREAQAHRAVAQNFDSADTDRDGELSVREFVRTPVNRLDQPGWSRTANRG